MTFSVFQLPDGRWRAVAQVRDSRTNGKAPKTIERKTEKKARDAMRDWLKEYDATIPRRGMSVESMLTQYVARCKAKGRATSTIRNYEADAIRWEPIGHIPISDLQASDVEAVLAGMPVKAGINARAFLRAAINKVARKADPKLPNVAGLAEPEPYKREPQVIPTWPEFIAIANAEPNESLRAHWLLLGFTGLRPDEVRELQPSEIHSRGDKGVWIVLDESKTPEGRKAIPVPAEAAEALLALPMDGKYVWSSHKTGKGWSQTHLCKKWHTACARIGISGPTLYSLRHLYASYMAGRVEPYILKRLMRHTSIKTTMQYYVEAFPDELQEAAAQVGQPKTPQQPHRKGR